MIRINEILKNPKGSSLAFVIIIGMIIMIMVVSLLSVANSDFTFTQQTVESRQAYIDAKSVIEFGKIEIKERKEWLQEKNNDLNDLYEEKAASTTTAAADAKQVDIDQLLIEIRSHMTAPYYIGYDGEGSSVVKTLNTVSTELEAIGVLKVAPKPEDALNTTNFTFDIKTKGLRRVLNYQVGLNDVSSGSNGSNNIIPPRPNPSEFYNPTIGSSGWTATQIKMPEWQIPKCFVNGEVTGSIANNKLTVNTHNVEEKSNLYINQFDWANEKPTLDLTANNLCFSAFIPNQQYGSLSIPIVQAESAQYNFSALGNGTIADPDGQLRYQGNYVQNNHEKITMNAKIVMFDGNLIMGSSSKLDITCDTLYVKGNLNINYKDGSWSELNITANNIVVEGNVEVGSYSKLRFNCPNVWIDGNINTWTSTPVLEFQNVNYLKAGNINLADKCQFTVNGADPKKSQMEVNSIAPFQSNAYKINISNLWSFKCTGLSLNNNSSLELNSNIVLINGNFTLGPQGIEPLTIKTQYFDCSGITTMDDLKGDFAIKRIDENKPLYVRFKGGYEQTSSWASKGVIIGEKNKNATLVVFGEQGTTVDLNEVNVFLNIMADDICFDCDGVEIQKKNNFSYSNGKATANDKTNFYTRNEIDYEKNKPVLAGNHYYVKGEFPQMLHDKNPAPYDPPKFPNPPGSGGPAIPGPEKYY